VEEIEAVLGGVVQRRPRLMWVGPELSNRFGNIAHSLGHDAGEDSLDIRIVPDRHSPDQDATPFRRGRCEMQKHGRRAQCLYWWPFERPR
jgi:hypothetical protein